MTQDSRSFLYAFLHPRAYWWMIFTLMRPVPRPPYS